MSIIEICQTNIEVEKQKIIKVSLNSTSNDIKLYLESHSLVELLVEGSHWFNNQEFDKFLCSLDLEKIRIDELYDKLGCNSLLLSCFLVLPDFSIKLIENYPEQIKHFSKDNYSPLSIALLTMPVNSKMETVVNKMLDFPDYCNLKNIHRFSINHEAYIWQYCCKVGYKDIIERLFDECLPFFNLEDSNDLENSTPLYDLISHDVGRVVIEMIKNHRSKCHLEKVVKGKTAFLYSLIKGHKLTAIHIACNYDDCNFKHIDPRGLTAFELLIAYGYQGIVSDILETRRDLYYDKFINNRAKNPFELALVYKNWDIAALLVAHKYISYEQLKNTTVLGIPLNQYLVMNNEQDLIKFFNFIEEKYNPKPKKEQNNDGWEKIKELGLEPLIRDIMKDPIAFANNSKGNIPEQLSKLSGLSNIKIDTKNLSKKIEPKKEDPIKLTVEEIPKPEPKKRGRPRKVKPEE